MHKLMPAHHILPRFALEINNHDYVRQDIILTGPELFGTFGARAQAPAARAVFLFPTGDMLNDPRESTGAPLFEVVGIRKTFTSGGMFA